MAINTTDFDKIWASTSPLTPYSFTDANYQEGWNFVGSTPPARQMWDGYMKWSDEKQQWIVNNFLPLSGGTMTGTLTLDDGGTALSDATVGTVVSASISSDVSVPASTATEVTHISLTKGVWVVTGHVTYPSASLTTQKAYGCSVGGGSSFSYTADGSVTIHTSHIQTIALVATRVITLSATTTINLIAYATASTSVNAGQISAVRIV